ncbi:hypothetical protein CPT_Spernnie_081 [Streptomyces phage Spernnie]|uniref:Uncharacterized protein n=1 Tax=Streptomyces phage Spernnie TaxID=2767588 RepID=A0A873WNQ0_9CAUD|nr:hypothetical protein KGG74_gp81 [Streptomyces phage Spernnie]QPB09685.1 hypothetical protein CPT_Spernnie_081 [Streptomyces phage Spernnie]
MRPPARTSPSQPRCRCWGSRGRCPPATGLRVGIAVRTTTLVPDGTPPGPARRSRLGLRALQPTVLRWPASSLPASRPALASPRHGQLHLSAERLVLPGAGRRRSARRHPCALASATVHVGFVAAHVQPAMLR